MKTTIIQSLAAVALGFIGSVIGGWDRTLEILSVFIVIDYITGMASAYKRKELLSSTGFIGLLRKAAMYAIVILAAQLDKLADTNGFFRTSTAIFFIANEGLSIFENVDELGVKLPKFLISHLKKLRDKHDTLEEHPPDIQATDAKPPDTQSPEQKEHNDKDNAE